jgi:broad specificity phosphatase PhoE
MVLAAVPRRENLSVASMHARFEKFLPSCSDACACLNVVDHLGSRLDDRRSPGNMDLIIVRHARPIREERAVEDGPADPPLSERGLGQANRAADFLAAEPIDHLVASSMLRAHQTAMPLAERLGFEIELRDDLREADQHSNRYVPIEEMTPDDPFIKELIADPLSIFGGDYDSFFNRVVGGFDDIIAENSGRTVAVYCHAMVMSVYLQSLWGLKDPFQSQPGYTGIHRVRASSSTGLRTVRSVNETGHVRDLLQ